MIGNLILEMTNAPGTAADCLLTGPTSGRLPFSFAFGSGSQCFYVLADGTQSEWGVGTYTAGSPNKLTRTTVLKNSAGSTARLNFLGSTRVYNEVPAERLLWIDNAGNVAVSGATILAAGFNASKSGGALLSLQDPAAASDAKIFDFISAGGNLYGRAINDLYNAANNWLTVTRTGYAVASITLAATNIALNGATAVAGSLSATGALSVTGAVTAGAASGGQAVLQPTGAAQPGYLALYQTGTRVGYVGYNNGSNLLTFTAEASYAGWQVTGSLTVTQAVTLNSSLGVNGNYTSPGTITATGSITSGSALNLSGGASLTMDANYTYLFMDGAQWRWQYARATGVMTYYRGGDSANLFSIDGSGNTTLAGKLIVPVSDTSISAVSHGGYLTINGSTAFANAANLIINGQGRSLYAFEYYWGTTRIGGIDMNGNLLNGAGIYVNYNAIGQNFAIFGDGGGRAIQFQSDGWKLVWGTDGSLTYRDNNGFALSWTDGAGNFSSRGAMVPNNPSDERLKRNITPYTHGLAELIQLQPISFEYNGLGGTNDDGKRRIGLVAQQIQPLLPECVYFSPRPPLDPFIADPPPDERLPDQLSLDDKPLGYAVINALRELNDQDTDLKALVVALAARVAVLEAAGARC